MCTLIRRIPVYKIMRPAFCSGHANGEIGGATWSLAKTTSAKVFKCAICDLDL